MALVYGAITIDTSVFDRYGLNFDKNPLKSLEQFSNKPAGLVLSDIVLREVHGHLKKRIEESRSALQKALRESGRLEIPHSAVDVMVKHLDSVDSSDRAVQVLEEFSRATGFHTISSEKYVNTGDLVKKYFNSEPPFAESGQKKSEFPDAICLMSLEAYAQEKNIKIIAVSGDGDWAKFADKSEWIDAEPELSQALAKFHPQKSAYDFCQDFFYHWQEKKYESLRKDLTLSIERKVESMDVMPEATSHLHWEMNDIAITLESFEFVATGNPDDDIRPIQIHSSGLTFAARLRIFCRAEGDFSLSVYDSFDKDYTYLGGCSESADFEIDSEVFVTVVGDLSGPADEIEIDNVDLNNGPVWINFGELDPDWHDEDYD